eukprot:3372128-Amphidinium_carterae.1
MKGWKVVRNVVQQKDHQGVSLWKAALATMEEVTPSKNKSWSLVRTLFEMTRVASTSSSLKMCAHTHSAPSSCARFLSCEVHCLQMVLRVGPWPQHQRPREAGVDAAFPLQYQSNRDLMDSAI